MNRKTALWTLVIIAILVSSSLLIVWTFLPADKGEEEEVVDAEFFVGVQLGYGNVDDYKALVDKVQNYTNLFVVSSPEVTEENATLTETCDYIYDAGLNFIVYFQYTTTNHNFAVQNWTKQAKEAYGDQYLGEFYFDEIGGKQLDMGYPSINTVYSYEEATNQFMEIIDHYSEPFKYGGKDFSSDYALYWFDYKAGFDTVLAAFGWNQSRQLQISQCRGAANVHNKDWGAMLTWTYNHPPYLESGPELYDDLLLAYRSGAKYAVVFNHIEDEEYSDYGLLADEHFEALENFWKYKNDNPKEHGSLTADVAFVLPQYYGFGFRDANDRVWRNWREHHSAKMWNEVNSALDEYGSRLDIVYSDPAYVSKVEGRYDTVLTWEFDDAEGFPVRNLNTGLGYPTIQGAIDSGYTLNGHEIYVTAGTYYENVLLRKQVTLRGENKMTTIIDGGNKGTAVTIVLSGAEDADPEAGATVTGFTIRNGDVPLPEDDRFIFGFLVDSLSDAGAGISVRAPNCCIIGNDIIDSNCGVCISSSGNVTLRDNNIAGNVLNLILEGDSLSHFINDIDTSNTVDDKMVHYLVNERNMKIDSSFSDIGFLALVNCTNMTVQDLSLEANGQGMLLVGTTNSTVTGNTITKNQEGIRMFASSDNVLRNNSINDNVYNLWIQNGTLNDIDTSNTVAGKPVIYWINQQNRTVPDDAGYVALINCKDIVAQNLNITNNRQAILLSYTTNSSIIDNQISNNYHGVQLENCTGINITGNSVENNQARGIYIQGSNNNSIKNNAITENGVGIQIGDKYIGRDDANVNNQIVGNNITENRHGIEIELLSINLFYHNSFIKNTEQFSFTSYAVDDESLLLNWDNGVEGNYWSDYVNKDLNHDGVLDTEYEITTILKGFAPIENGPSVPVYITIADRYPLNGMFVSFTQSGQTFTVVSNSTISDVHYNQAENMITLQATTEGFGFCRIAIPHTAMDVDSVSVVINGGQVQAVNTDYQLYDDGNSRWIYFAYPEGTQEIQITTQQP